MKKIIFTAICLALCASVALTSCAKKDDDKNEEVNNNEVVETNTPEEDKEEAEEEKVIFEYDFNSDGAVLIAYYGEDELEEVVLEEKPIRMKKEKQKVKVEEEVTNADGTVSKVEKEVEETVLVPIEYELIAIDEGVFMNNTTVKKIVVPNTVKEIGKACFQGCTALEEVVLPEGLEEIGDMMFYNCPALTTLNIPETVKTIGIFAFSDYFNSSPWYEGLTDESVIVGDGILLKYNGTATEVVYGDEVKSIAYYAFLDTPVETVKVTNAITENVHSLAFYRTSGKLFVPESIDAKVLSAIKGNSVKVETYEG